MFVKWLKTKKAFTEKSARDVYSRVKRVQNIIKVDEISEGSIEQLEKTPEFATFSPSVRSQLRRASKLYLEYQKAK